MGAGASKKTVPDPGPNVGAVGPRPAPEDLPRDEELRTIHEQTLDQVPDEHRQIAKKNKPLMRKTSSMRQLIEEADDEQRAKERRAMLTGIHGSQRHMRTSQRKLEVQRSFGRQSSIKQLLVENEGLARAESPHYEASSPSRARETYSPARPGTSAMFDGDDPSSSRPRLVRNVSHGAAGFSLSGDPARSSEAESARRDGKKLRKALKGKSKSMMQRAQDANASDSDAASPARAHAHTDVEPGGSGRAAPLRARETDKSVPGEPSAHAEPTPEQLQTLMENDTPSQGSAAPGSPAALQWRAAKAALEMQQKRADIAAVAAADVHQRRLARAAARRSANQTWGDMMTRRRTAVLGRPMSKKEVARKRMKGFVQQYKIVVRSGVHQVSGNDADLELYVGFTASAHAQPGGLALRATNEVRSPMPPLQSNPDGTHEQVLLLSAQAELGDVAFVSVVNKGKGEVAAWELVHIEVERSFDKGLVIREKANKRRGKKGAEDGDADDESNPTRVRFPARAWIEAGQVRTFFPQTLLPRPANDVEAAARRTELEGRRAEYSYHFSEGLPSTSAFSPTDMPMDEVPDPKHMLFDILEEGRKVLAERSLDQRFVDGLGKPWRSVNFGDARADSLYAEVYGLEGKSKTQRRAMAIATFVRPKFKKGGEEARSERAQAIRYGRQSVEVKGDIEKQKDVVSKHIAAIERAQTEMHLQLQAAKAAQDAAPPGAPPLNPDEWILAANLTMDQIDRLHMSYRYNEAWLKQLNQPMRIKWVTSSEESAAGSNDESSSDEERLRLKRLLGDHGSGDSLEIKRKRRLRRKTKLQKELEAQALEAPPGAQSDSDDDGGGGEGRRTKAVLPRHDSGAIQFPRLDDMVDSDTLGSDSSSESDGGLEVPRGALRGNFPMPSNMKDDAWAADLDFGQQFLMGAHPCAIEIVRQVPPEFLCLDDDEYDELLEQLLPRDHSLEEEAHAGRVALVDYSRVMEAAGMQASSVKVAGERRHVCAPRILFYYFDTSVRTAADGAAPMALALQKRALLPIAIVLAPARRGQARRRVFTPLDHPSVWLAAKTAAASVDAQIHLGVSWYLKTVAVMEPIAVCMHRNLVSGHPIFRLLHTFLRHAISTGVAAREWFLGEHGFWAQTAAMPVPNLLRLLREEYKTWSLETSTMPGHMEAMGVLETTTIRTYPFRDDGMILWKVIVQFVGEYVALFYPDDFGVQDDAELQAFFEELSTVALPYDEDAVDPDAGATSAHSRRSRRAASAPGQSRSEGKTPRLPQRPVLTQVLDSRSALVGLLAAVVWTASVQHAAMTSGMYDALAHVGCRPLKLLRKPPGQTTGQVNRAAFSLMLPDQRSTLLTVAVSFLLTRGTAAAGESLGGGRLPALYLDGHPEVEEIVRRFERSLQAVEEAIKIRNTGRKPAYERMMPSRINQCVGTFVNEGDR
ncbi:unnamed protein product [Pedinophyceae sp. YPF-701]|nr:unnamed protein product [Pedinophyceae sp. YPF-701]